MKTIGFIDIPPQSRLCGQCTVAGEPPDVPEQDDFSGYLFKDSGQGGYAFERKLNGDNRTDLNGIDAFYVSLPANMFDFRILSVPFADKEKIARIVPFELDQLIMGGSGEIVFDSVVIGENGTSLDVLAVYIDRNALNRVLEELALKKIDPRVVTSLDLETIIGAGKETTRGGFEAALVSHLAHPPEWDEQKRIRAAEQVLSQLNINLRTGSLAYTKDEEKTGRMLKIAAVLAFLTVMIVHANIFFQTFMVQREASRVAKEMRTDYGKLFPGEKKTMDELYQLRSHLREIGEKNEALSGVSPLRLLLELSRRTVANEIYTDIHIEKNLIRMKAEASSMGDLDKIRMKLSEILPGASLSDVRPSSNGKVLFNVVAKDAAL